MSYTVDGSPSANDVTRNWSERPGRGVIFDFNGTLSDDEPILQRIFTDLFREHLGWVMSAQEYATQLLGRSDREIVESAVHTHGSGDSQLIEHLLALRGKEYRTVVARQSPITAGSLEVVGALHRSGVPMAIVTGAQREDVRAVIDNCGVGDMIKVLVTEEDVVHGKPDPEGFLLAADMLGLRAEDLLVFEDSVPGATGAVRAGMACIGVARTSSQAMISMAVPTVPALDGRVLSSVVF